MAGWKGALSRDVCAAQGLAALTGTRVGVLAKAATGQGRRPRACHLLADDLRKPGLASRQPPGRVDQALSAGAGEAPNASGTP